MERNWIRARAALQGFYLRFGRWPTRLLLPDYAMRDFREVYFSEESIAKIQVKLELVEADVPIVASDADGNEYSYGEEGFPDGDPEIGAEQWLGVSPNWGNKPFF